MLADMGDAIAADLLVPDEDSGADSMLFAWTDGAPCGTTTDVLLDVIPGPSDAGWREDLYAGT